MNISDAKATDFTSLVDLDQLDASVAGDPGLKREIVDLYFQQAGEIMPKLAKAIEMGDVPEVNHLSHKLAGSSLSCGMTAVVAPLRELEHNARAGHLNGAQDLFANVGVQMEAMQQFMQKHLPKP
jgi:HPt (histidine-containing phosphotransfer) domain-containing protein